MAKGFNRGGGMPNNMNNMLKQAQKMQQEMEKAQEEMEQQSFEASAGGGAVAVVMKGNKEILSVKIKPEVVDPDDVEMLEDLIMAAVNEAHKKVSETMEEGMSKLTGGINIPGIF